MRANYKTPAPRRAIIKPTPAVKKKNPLLTLGKILYGILVAISTLIVVGYLAFTFFVPEPEVVQPQPENTPPTVAEPEQKDPAQTGDPAQPGKEALERREGVYNVLLAGTDADGYRTDTMMVMSYDTKAQTVGVVSIPRDTLIDRPSGENPKLVYGKGGVEQRVEDISDLLGVPIDYYIKIDLRGFIAVVDYLEGIDFYVPCDMDYDDPYQNLSIHFKEGMQHLDGQEVMEVARFRKNNDLTGYSDTGRTDTQQKLLIALAKKVLSWNSLTKLNGFVEIFNEYVKTDMSLSNMLYFASQAIYVDTANGVQTATLTGNGEVRWHGQSYCFQLDEQFALDTVNALINPYTRDLTLEDMNIFTVQ